MSKRHIAVAGLLVATALVGACSDRRSPVAPSAEPGGVQQNRVSAGQGQVLERQAEMARLSQEIPGFGGMYYDASGQLNVYVNRGRLAAAASGTETRSRIRKALRSRTATAAAADNVVVQEGDYDYGQLADWNQQLISVLAMKGAVYTTVKQDRNRVFVALNRNATTAQRRAVRRAVAALSIPDDAVIFGLKNPITPLATLTQLARPVTAGVEISFPSGSSFFLCTLGFNLRGPAPAGGNYFVTNSHCSGQQGGTEFTPYYQPRRADTTYIGMEVVDPQYGTAGGYCAATQRCRFTDALLGQYHPDIQVAFGSIARTTFSLQRIGSIEIDPAAPRFSIVAEQAFPLVGERLSKIGWRSGWTTGRVVDVCVNTLQGDTNIILLCQDFVDAGVQPGDSGSPVFAQIGTSSNIRLYGVLWGGDLTNKDLFVFGSMEQIRYELGLTGYRTF